VKQLPKVFVVDDHPAVIEVIETILSAEPYRLECCLSAEEFMFHHRPNEVGCLIIDLVARGEIGRELVRQLHRTRSALAIVNISGLIDPALRDRTDKSRSRLVGLTYELQTLVTMIEDAIAGSERRQQR
jgi:FixJ family two-component response regulator